VIETRQPCQQLKGLAWLAYVFNLFSDDFLDHLLSTLENKTTRQKFLARSL
jgi:hypothetical protein